MVIFFMYRSDFLTFTKGEVWRCYQFAHDMIGNHNRDMIMDREDWEIFRDDLRGKLGEAALRKYVLENIPNAVIDGEIDYEVTPLGQWDITDLIIDGQYINVKSVKGNSRFLLVETNRYDADGNYSYRNNDGEPVRIDAYVLVRVSIEPEINWNDMNYTTIEEFKTSRGGRHIEAEILGAISHEDFWRNKHFAPRHMKCDYKNLQAVCNGEKIEMLQGGGKKESLQRDNYILDSKNELITVQRLLGGLDAN